MLTPAPGHTLRGTSGHASGRTLFGGLALIMALGASVVVLQGWRDRHVHRVEPIEEVLYVRSPAAMRRMAIGFDGILSDVYWMRALQYYGGTRLSSSPGKTYNLLYPLLDLTTTLDPHFSVAYRFGAFFLSERAPDGAGRSDLAVRLLEKGMAADPARWEYPYDIGFVYYRQGDYGSAASWFERASHVPKAPVWVGPLAAVTLSKGGDLASSRVLWRNILETTDQPWFKASAERHLRQLDALDAITTLQQIVTAYRERFGVPATGWADLIRAGALRGVPLDPTGVPYVLDSPRGTVTVGPQSDLSPLPTEGQP